MQYNIQESSWDPCVHKNAVYAEAILLLYTTYRHSAPCRLQTASVGWLKHQNLCGCYRGIRYLYNMQTWDFLHWGLLKPSWQAKNSALMSHWAHRNMRHPYSYRHDLVFVYFMKRMVTSCTPSRVQFNIQTKKKVTKTPKPIKQTRLA